MIKRLALGQRERFIRGLYTASGCVLILLFALLSTACAQQRQREHTLGRVSITIPAGWEQKPGALAFRTGKGTTKLRFIAVIEEPLAKGYSPEQQAKLLESAVLGIDGTTKLAEHDTRISGKPAHVMEFRRVQGSKPAIRGEHITIPLRDRVVTVFWYVYESDWREGQKEMEAIVKSIRIK